MKHLKFALILFVSTALIFSCNPKDDKPGTTKIETPVEENKPAKWNKANLKDVLSASEFEAISTASEKARGRKPKFAEVVTIVEWTFTLSHSGGSSFGIDYGGATNLVYHFFRGGDSLSASGNVYPLQSMPFFTPIASWTSTFTRPLYQSVVVTGSTTPNAEGVIGTDWVVTYSNVVN